MSENEHGWVHQNYVCLLVKETDRFVSLHNIFAVFLISLQIFNNVMDTADHVHVTKPMV